MTIALVTLLAVVAIAALGHPFWAARRGARATRDHAEELAEGLRRARDRVYEEIRALQQERFLGTLSPEEHEAQLASARRRAAELVRAQQQAEDVVREIEQGVDAELDALLGEDEEERG